MRIESKDAEYDAVLDFAKRLCVAARTAPKGCGVDNMDALILTGEEKATLTAEMQKIGSELGSRGDFFIRDAHTVDTAQVIVLLGISYKTRGLSDTCQLCGFDSCVSCEAAGATCVFVGIDLGIALGSVVAKAAHEHVDNRIYFTAGKAARNMHLLGEHTLIMGVPLYAGGKNPFFDRNSNRKRTDKLNEFR